MPKRDKLYVEYPICLSYNQAIAWLKAGHEVWQEDLDDFPQCGGFDDIDCFKDNFPDEELSYSDNIHLVPATPEMINSNVMDKSNIVGEGSSPTSKQIDATIEHLKKYGVI
jgi:hypothetical protein